MARGFAQGINQGVNRMMPFALDKMREKRRGAAGEERKQSLMSALSTFYPDADPARLEAYAQLNQAGLSAPIGVLEGESVGRAAAMEEVFKLLPEEEQPFYRSAFKAGAVSPEMVFKAGMADKKERAELASFIENFQYARENPTHLDSKQATFYRQVKDDLGLSDEAAQQLIPAMRVEAGERVKIVGTLEQVQAGATWGDLSGEQVELLTRRGYKEDFINRLAGKKDIKIADIGKFGNSVYEADLAATFPTRWFMEDQLTEWMQNNTENVTKRQVAFFEKYYDKTSGTLRHGVIGEAGLTEYEALTTKIDALAAKLSLPESSKRWMKETFYNFASGADPKGNGAPLPPENIVAADLIGKLPYKVTVEMFMDAYEKFWKSYQEK